MKAKKQSKRPKAVAVAKKVVIKPVPKPVFKPSIASCVQDWLDETTASAPSVTERDRGEWFAEHLPQLIDRLEKREGK